MNAKGSVSNNPDLDRAGTCHLERKNGSFGSGVSADAVDVCILKVGGKFQRGIRVALLAL